MFKKKTLRNKPLAILKLVQSHKYVVIHEDWTHYSIIIDLQE